MSRKLGTPITITASVPLTIEMVAEAFAEMDNHEQLAFFEHAVKLMNQTRPGAADYQACWIATADDMSQDLCTFFACLQRDTMEILRRYKP
jgi:folate-dependent tRNA-U54 methylase TrmFO/GidA